MDTAGALTVIASYRGGTLYTPAWETIVIMSTILAMTVAAVPMVIHLRRRARRPRTVRDEWQTITVMGELCPYGWQATITLYGWGAPIPDDAPHTRGRLVALEWQRFAGEPDGTVSGRVWAATIGEALQMMVDDSLPALDAGRRPGRPI